MAGKQPVREEERGAAQSPGAGRLRFFRHWDTQPKDESCGLQGNSSGGLGVGDSSGRPTQRVGGGCGHTSAPGWQM